MMHSKAMQVGQGRRFSTMDELIQSESGEYQDRVNSLTPAQKYANLALPSGPDPRPFKKMSGPLGPGRGGV